MTPTATPWPDDGDSAFLAALEAPRSKRNHLTPMIAALLGAIWPTPDEWAVTQLIARKRSDTPPV